MTVDAVDLQDGYSVLGSTEDLECDLIVECRRPTAVVGEDDFLQVSLCFGESVADGSSLADRVADPAVFDL